MARKLKCDAILFIATLLLVCVKQALWTALGLAVLAIAIRVDYRTYRNEAFIWVLVGIVAAMLVGVLFSAPVNGTRRWFGFGGLGIQPSELAKIGCVLFTAIMLERRM